MEQTIAQTHRPLITSSAVMKWLGYADGPSFWRFAKASGLPHVRLNRRRIMFSPDQVEDWIAHRTVGGDVHRP